MAREIGYDPKTTFWQDFSVADCFGLKAIKETYKRAFDEWKGNYIYLTELVLVLNHKIWFWFGKDDVRADLYNELWQKTDHYACSNLKDDELSYFYRTID